MARSEHEETDEAVRREVKRLLLAATEFTRAYHAWQVLPDKRAQLEEAEKKLTDAEHRVAVAQTKGPPPHEP